MQNTMVVDGQQVEIIAAPQAIVGTGGFGTVFLGYSPQCGEVALKRQRSGAPDADQEKVRPRKSLTSVSDRQRNSFSVLSERPI